jgi:hypothetical protein
MRIDKLAVVWCLIWIGFAAALFQLLDPVPEVYWGGAIGSICCICFFRWPHPGLRGAVGGALGCVVGAGVDWFSDPPLHWLLGIPAFVVYPLIGAMAGGFVGALHWMVERVCEFFDDSRPTIR